MKLHRVQIFMGIIFFRPKTIENQITHAVRCEWSLEENDNEGILQPVQEKMDKQKITVIGYKKKNK